MLVSKTVEMAWGCRNKTYYISKGYEFTSFGNKFIVDVKHLTEHSNVKVIAKCDVCDNEKVITYYNYKEVVTHNSKYICSRCNAIGKMADLNVKNTKTGIQFKKEVYKLVKNEYSILGEYINSHTKILMKHSKCGNEFYTQPNTFLRRKDQCLVCAKNKRDLINAQTSVEINNKIETRNKTSYEIVTPYKNRVTPMSIKCLVCEEIHEVLPFTLQTGKHYCPSCRKIKINSTVKTLKYKPRVLRNTEYVRDEINTLTNGEYELIGEYTTCMNPFSIKHNVCGHIFNTRIHDFIDKGCRCPQCYIENKCKEWGISVDDWGNGGCDDRRRMQKWGTKVKKKDNKKCVICGNSKNLNAHHLNGYHWDIENRDNIDNGVTLCETCHHNFHDIYGWGGNTKEQFEEFEKPKQLALII